MKTYYLYILTNSIHDVFRIEITDDTAKYVNEVNINENNRALNDFENLKLVYYEKAGNVLQAINMRKKLEKWESIWLKILIDTCNPDWNDLKDEFMKNGFSKEIKIVKNRNLFISKKII